MRGGKGIRITIVLASLAALVAVAPGVAAAQTEPQTYDVTVQEDVPDGKGCTPDHCTLREAVDAAGSQSTVNVPAGTYALELGELLLVSDTIEGEDARKTIIDGGDKSRVLFVTDGTTTVSGVTIRDGNGFGEQERGLGAHLNQPVLGVVVVRRPSCLPHVPTRLLQVVRLGRRTTVLRDAREELPESSPGT